MTMTSPSRAGEPSAVVAEGMAGAARPGRAPARRSAGRWIDMKDAHAHVLTSVRIYFEVEGLRCIDFSTMRTRCRACYL